MFVLLKRGFYDLDGIFHRAGVNEFSDEYGADWLKADDSRKVEDLFPDDAIKVDRNGDPLDKKDAKAAKAPINSPFLPPATGGPTDNTGIGAVVQSGGQEIHPPAAPPTPVGTIDAPKAPAKKA